jgi:hypothetical protein
VLRDDGNGQQAGAAINSEPEDDFCGPDNHPSNNTLQREEAINLCESSQEEGKVEERAAGGGDHGDPLCASGDNGDNNSSDTIQEMYT